ncbi:MAG: sigma factor [Alphaproteobacteria bacterium]
MAAYMPLARALARPWRRRWPNEADDFASEALLALSLAAAAFDPARGVGFATFARPRIVARLIDLHRGLTTRAAHERPYTDLGGDPDHLAEVRRPRDYRGRRTRVPLSRRFGAA